MTAKVEIQKVGGGGGLTRSQILERVAGKEEGGFLQGGSLQFLHKK